MEDEAHLVIVRLIEEVERLQAEKKDCDCSHVQTLGAESKEFAAEAASKAREVKEAQSKLLEDAFAILGRAACKARKTSAPSTGAKLQGTKRKADGAQTADRESFERQTVDLVSLSPPPSPKASPIKKSRQTLRLSRDVDISSNWTTLRSDAAAPSAANASLASRPRDFGFI